MKKELTSQQEAFLEALFGEAKGNPVEAKRIAGYAESTKTSFLISSLKDEIISQAKLILALNSPRAAFELVDTMINPNQAGASTKLKAVQEILDRAGVADKAKSDGVDLKVPQGGLFIMPAKGAKVVQEDVLMNSGDEVTDEKDAS